MSSVARIIFVAPHEPMWPLARILPVNNFAKNFLRFSTCAVGVDEGTLENFGVRAVKEDAWECVRALTQEATKQQHVFTVRYGHGFFRWCG